MSSQNCCTAWRDELVAYADHALDAHTRDAIARHLVGCASCRQELADLRAVRSIVATAPLAAAAPEGLADRLVAIAGPNARSELCLARAGDACLPSLRSRRRQRLAVGASGAVLAMGGVLGGAWLLAPDLPGVDDPDATNLVPANIQAALLSSASDQVSCPQPFSCPHEVDGMRLLSVVTDSQTQPTKVRAVYADAQDHVTVVQQRGVLASDDSSSDGRLVWQSSDLVICVHGDEQERTEKVAEAFPHEEPVGQGMDRIRAGLRSLAGHRGR